MESCTFSHQDACLWAPRRGSRVEVTAGGGRVAGPGVGAAALGRRIHFSKGNIAVPTARPKTDCCRFVPLAPGDRGGGGRWQGNCWQGNSQSAPLAHALQSREIRKEDSACQHVRAHRESCNKSGWRREPGLVCASRRARRGLARTASLISSCDMVDPIGGGPPPSRHCLRVEGSMGRNTHAPSGSSYWLYR